MSGLVGLTGIDAHVTERQNVIAMLARLAHRGPDGSDLLAGRGHVLAHSHFWTTPEEVGERQPLVDSESGLRLVLDGRIDNRADLERVLGDSSAPLTDARLLLRAYVRWGKSCFEHLLGPFAVLIWDSKADTLVAARDPMGDRTLFYASVPGGMAIASEEQALLAHPSVRPELDEETLARHFAIEAPRAGRTFFGAIRELPPGSLLVVAGDRLRVETFFTPAPPEPIRYRRDEEYAEHLASVLGDAVESRLRSSAPVGVSLSGGMDSPSVAALAVERLARTGGASKLSSFSWVFDELPPCDERRWIDPVVASLGLEATRVVADGYWPLRDVADWPLNPNTPLSNAYRTLKQALYAAAAARGVRTLLIGVFSDRLFVGRETWLAARVAGGEWKEPFRHLARLQAARPPTPVWRDPALRALARRLAPFLSRSVPPETKPPWLTSSAWNLVEESRGDLPPVPREIRQRRTAAVFDDLRGLWPGEMFFASKAPLDIRDPFRDLRVVRYMLAIPPDQLQRGAVEKYVLRRAMRGRLPDAVVDRTTKTPLDPFYRTSLFEREVSCVERLLRAPDALWHGRIDASWLLDGFPGKFFAMPDGRGLLVPYYAASTELWNRTRRDLPHSPPG